MSTPSIACFLLAAAIALWTILRWRASARAWMPARLKAARLVRVEEDLVVDAPYPMVGRPDQVYRELDGLHLPVELKRRNRVVIYDTDVAEISLRAWLLRLNGLPTARTGYIVVSVASTSERRAVEVILRDDRFCEDLVERYLDLLEGRRWPRKTAGPKCKTCSHLSYCPANP